MNPKCFGLICLIIFLAIADVQAQQVQISELTNVDRLISRYLTLERALWQVIRSGVPQSTSLRRIHDTHLTFFAEDFQAKNVFFDIDPDQRVLSNALNYINSTIANVDKSPLHSNEKDYNMNEAITFATNNIHMKENYDKIHNITEGSDFYGFIARKADLQSCTPGVSTIQSPHQLIYDYYNDIASAQLKAYALTQLSYMFFTVYDRRNYVSESMQREREFVGRTAKTQERVRELLAGASREVWVCDPDDPSKAVLEGHADEVTRLLQGYIDNEVNLNAVNDCKLSCSDYQLATNHLCYNGSYCAENTAFAPEADLKCNGAVVGCDFVGNDMTICPTNDIKKKRYQSITYDKGVTFGKGGVCPQLETRALSWTRWFVHCSTCFCYCDEKGPNSDRFFSLREVLSDVARNKVITGVALRKHNRVFTWRISERTLTAYGQVSKKDNSPLDLTPATAFRLTDAGVTEGIDYHTLNYQNRSLELDVLEAPKDHVVTGVRFVLRPCGKLALEIRATKFDFSTGRLDLNAGAGLWVTNDNKDKTELQLERPDVPIRALSKSVPDLRANQFVRFQPTDRVADVAQSTVPFVDIQKVEPHHPVPLAGLGLYHKGQPLFGGYVAPKVVTYNYGPHVGGMQ